MAVDVWVVAEVDDGCVVGRLDAVGVAQVVAPTNVVERSILKLVAEVLNAELTEPVAITANTEYMT